MFGVITDNRYRFHIKNAGSLSSIKIVSANLRNILNNSHEKRIILYAVDNEQNKNTELSVPYDWIVKVEYLDLQDSPISNSDILLNINNI